MQRLSILRVILFLSGAGTILAQPDRAMPRFDNDRDSLSYAVGLDLVDQDLPRVHDDSLRSRVDRFIDGVREGMLRTDVPGDSVTKVLAGTFNRGSFLNDSLSRAAGVTVMALLRNARAESGIDIDPDLMIAGILDGWNNTPRFDVRMRRMIMSTANDHAAGARMKRDMFRRDSLYAFNIVASRAYMAEHARHRHVVVIDDNVHYEVVSLGKGNTPKDGDRVIARYRGTLMDGRGFVDTQDGTGSSRVEVGAATPGLGPALLSMKPGERRRVTAVLPPGNAAYWNGAPPGVVLQFDVELVSIVGQGK